MYILCRCCHAAVSHCRCKPWRPPGINFSTFTASSLTLPPSSSPLTATRPQSCAPTSTLNNWSFRTSLNVNETCGEKKKKEKKKERNSPVTVYNMLITFSFSIIYFRVYIHRFYMVLYLYTYYTYNSITYSVLLKYSQKTDVVIRTLREGNTVFVFHVYYVIVMKNDQVHSGSHIKCYFFYVRTHMT